MELSENLERKVVFKYPPIDANLRVEWIYYGYCKWYYAHDGTVNNSNDRNNSNININSSNFEKISRWWCYTIYKEQKSGLLHIQERLHAPQTQ